MIEIIFCSHIDEKILSLFLHPTHQNQKCELGHSDDSQRMINNLGVISEIHKYVYR